MDEQLREEFEKNGYTLEDALVAEKCASLCSSFSLNPEALVQNWEAYSLNSQHTENEVRNSQIDGFRLCLQIKQRDALLRQQAGMHIYTKENVGMLVDAMEIDDQTPSKVAVSGGIPRRTPSSAARSEELEGLSPATPFSQRAARCCVQQTFNEHLVEVAQPGNHMDEGSDGLLIHRLKDVRRCALEILSSGPKAGSRYMSDQMEARFDEIERRMKGFCRVFSDDQSRPLSQHVAYAVQDEVVVVGRICCDSEGRLNEKSVLLEGSVEYSGGHRVRLDFRDIPQFSIFPGQVLAVEGHNPSGHCLIASKLFSSVPLPPYSSDSGANQPFKRPAIESNDSSPLRSDSDEPLRVLVAAGPFTTSDNLSYEPLVELLQYCQKKRPNVLLLMGPFVDSEHPRVKQGTVDKPFLQIFQEEIRIRIEDYCERVGAGGRVVLVPSTRDVFHDRVFPQPPFDASWFEDPLSQITMLSNPGVLRVDELVIGCCTTDVLKHLSSEECSRIPAGVSSDRMTRIATHLIDQRSFYPLFPPVQGTRLDFSLGPKALELPCTPDMMLLPSDLVSFVKHVEYSSRSERTKMHSSLFVNPGRLAKGMLGGTFAEALIFPVTASTSEAQGVTKRTKLTIVRL